MTTPSNDTQYKWETPNDPISAYKVAAIAALRTTMKGRPKEDYVIAVQEVLQKVCGEANITLPEARDIYRHAVMASIGQDPDKQPGREWTPLKAPEGPPQWQPFPKPQ